jgi:hypothetical protein
MGTAFADLMINGHREIWPIRSMRASTTSYEATRDALSARRARRVARAARLVARGHVAFGSAPIRLPCAIPGMRRLTLH